MHKPCRNAAFNDRTSYKVGKRVSPNGGIVRGAEMMRRAVILWMCVLAVGIPAMVGATRDGQCVEETPAGVINWTRGLFRTVMTVSGKEAAALDDNGPGAACEAALAQMAALILETRIDSTRRVGDILAPGGGSEAALRRQIAATAALQQEKHVDGGIAIRAEIDMYGGIYNAILPPEIKQIDTIKTVSATPSAAAPAADADTTESTKAFTGVIVDARGVAFQAAIAPVIVDEAQEEVYGPAFVSREFAVQRGVCGYVGDIEAAKKDPRVIGNPLIVKGLRTGKNRSSHIVISSADAARIRSVSDHLSFLRSCRVVIVLDCGS